MNFFKMSAIIMIIILIVCLSIVGIIIRTSETEKVYPPNVNECPDYYVKQEDGTCEDVKNISSETNCKSINPSDQSVFTALGNIGIGSNSEYCEKKKWAEVCNVNWDGLTNNEDVCYSKN